MLTENANLRLSAQRALLGVISPTMRLIKVSKSGQQIAFTVIVDAPPSETDREALSIAATEIVADFPECNIVEQILIDQGPILREDGLAEGWVYFRAE
jgi:hypothetical protein